MTLEIKVGKPRLTLHQGYTVVVAEPGGEMRAGSSDGLFFRDTRLISVWEIAANEVPWTLLNSGSLSGSTGRAYLTNPDLPSEGAVFPPKRWGWCSAGMSMAACMRISTSPITTPHPCGSSLHSPSRATSPTCSR